MLEIQYVGTVYGKVMRCGLEHKTKRMMESWYMYPGELMSYESERYYTGYCQVPHQQNADISKSISVVKMQYNIQAYEQSQPGMDQ
jgi:hypothetical protein